MKQFQHVPRSARSASLCLAALLPVAGCLGPSEPRMCRDEQALVTGQGMELQGMHLNGVYVNGVYLNGVYLNGIDLQGIYVNGHDLGDAGIGGIRLEQTELVAEAGGETLRGEDFVGAEIELVAEGGNRVPLTIAEVAADADAPDLSYVTLEGPEGENLCGPGGRGLFLEGVWDETGARRDSFEVDGDAIDVTYSCTRGVIAKCLRWGYQPWEVGADMHQTCTRMARADYCGDGVGHTENGTPIDLFDREGIQVSESAPDGDFAFEAGWGPDGAVCAARPRYRDVEPSGDERLPLCFDELPRCTDWESAKSHGALTGNKSIPQARFLCEE